MMLYRLLVESVIHIVLFNAKGTSGGVGVLNKGSDKLRTRACI
jgi:hypothetical protein